MKSNYFDPMTYQQSSMPYEGYDYGVQHCSNETNQAINGFVFQKYPPVFISSKVRRHDRRGEYYNCPSATSDKYINTYVMARIFCMKLKGLDRQKILVENLGFKEVGSKFNDDKLFVYKYCMEAAQIEIYINDRGDISEINRFHQGNFYEIKIPIHIIGIQYVISQIFYDVCELNLSNISFSYYEKIQVQELLNLTKQLPNVDSMDSDNLPPIHDFNFVNLLEVSKGKKSLSWFSNVKKKFFN